MESLGLHLKIGLHWKKFICFLSVLMLSILSGTMDSYKEYLLK